MAVSIGRMNMKETVEEVDIVQVTHEMGVHVPLMINQFKTDITDGGKGRKKPKMSKHFNRIVVSLKKKLHNVMQAMFSSPTV